jgi:hypothetical protein
MADEDEAPKVVRRNTNYGSNSNKSKNNAAEPEERRKLESVVKGTAVKRKVPLGRRLAETFGGDSAHNVGQFIMFDVIIPAIKVMISDAVSQGFERLLFGGAARNRPIGSGYRPRQHTGYRSAFDSNTTRAVREISTQARSRHNFDEVILDTREEANDVLEALDDAIKEFGVATVADLYDLVGITGNFTDNQWGWTDLREANIRLISGGKYLINLPSTDPIN